MTGPAVEELRCVGCGCTEKNACPGGCHWVSNNPPVCSVCAEKAGGASAVFIETIGGSLIDAARISIMGARAMIPPAEPSRIVMPGKEEEPVSVHEALGEAMNWLDLARSITVSKMTGPPTSLHVVGQPENPQRTERST